MELPGRNPLSNGYEDCGVYRGGFCNDFDYVPFETLMVILVESGV